MKFKISQILKDVKKKKGFNQKRERENRRWNLYIKKKGKKRGSTWRVNLETSQPSSLKLTCVEIAPK